MDSNGATHNIALVAQLICDNLYANGFFKVNNPADLHTIAIGSSPTMPG